MYDSGDQRGQVLDRLSKLHDVQVVRAGKSRGSCSANGSKGENCKRKNLMGWSGALRAGARLRCAAPEHASWELSSTPCSDDHFQLNQSTCAQSHRQNFHVQAASALPKIAFDTAAATVVLDTAAAPHTAATSSAQLSCCGTPHTHTHSRRCDEGE